MKGASAANPFNLHSLTTTGEDEHWTHEEWNAWFRAGGDNGWTPEVSTENGGTLDAFGKAGKGDRKGDGKIAKAPALAPALRQGSASTATRQATWSLTALSLSERAQPLEQLRAADWVQVKSTISPALSFRS